jgi:8-oxo-dGTP pyrophosphatase MutT (NUDIX family)
MVKYIWHNGKNIENLNPITQIYSFCFKDNKTLLMKIQNRNWNIPGGTPEDGENLMETLNRELDEEVSISVSKSEIVGYYEVLLDEPIIFKGRKYNKKYQIRCASIIKELKPQKEDPDFGSIHKRKMVNPNKVFDYIVYDNYKPAFKEALKWYNKNK